MDASVDLTTTALQNRLSIISLRGYELAELAFGSDVSWYRQRARVGIINSQRADS